MAERSLSRELMPAELTGDEAARRLLVASVFEIRALRTRIRRLLAGDGLSVHYRAALELQREFLEFMDEDVRGFLKLEQTEALGRRGGE